MNKVIILNGPAGCGKDTIAEWLAENGFFSKAEFKKRLIQIALEIAHISRAQWDEMYTREEKEKPQQVLNWKTPREFLIDISERCIKPLMGNDYFGLAALDQIRNTYTVFSDSGFPEEVDCVRKHVGEDNLLVIRITRPGHTYANDSRGYLPCDVEVTNDGEVADLFLKIDTIVNEWLKLTQPHEYKRRKTDQLSGTKVT